MRHLLKNKTLFLIINTIFWLGLLVLLLSDRLRMMVGGSLLALALGGDMLYSAFSSKIARGLEEPLLVRLMAGSLGLFSAGLGVLMLIWVLRGNVHSVPQARRRSIEGQLAESARGDTYLDLSGQGLREIPPEVWTFDHVIWLDLSENRLTSLPPEIGQLTSLEDLRLYDNGLTSLPPEIGDLKNLENLDLYNNDLTSLPSEIGELESLTWLDLDGNRLETLPTEFVRLQQLTHLQIQHNRFTTFPDVLLEMPQLELLFLDGNRMGELPASITRRAEAGELKLAYRPGASSFDWASVSVIVFTFVLPLVLSIGVTRVWNRLEWKQQEAARRADGAVVFPITPQNRGRALFGTFGLAAFALFILIAGANEASTGIALESSVVLVLILVPIILGLAFGLLRNSGFFVLTRSGITVRRLGQRYTLRYDAITQVQAPAGFSVIKIWTPDRVLRIPHTVHEHPHLLELLLSYVPAPVRDAALGKLDLDAPVHEDGPVYTFRVYGPRWQLNVVVGVLYTLFYLGVSLLGLWSGLLQGDIPPFTADWVKSTLFFFLMMSVIFLPLLIYFVYTFWKEYGRFIPQEPIALQLYRDRLRYRLPRRRWQERPAADIQRVILEPAPAATHVRADGLRGEKCEMRHIVILHFIDGQRLIIGQQRIAQFGETPERLGKMVKHVYELK